MCLNSRCWQDSCLARWRVAWESCVLRRARRLCFLGGVRNCRRMVLMHGAGELRSGRLQVSAAKGETVIEVILIFALLLAGSCTCAVMLARIAPEL